MLVGLIVAMLITMALLGPLMQLSRRANVLALPNARTVHAEAMPQIGGLAIFCGFALPATLLAWGLPDLRVFMFSAVTVLTLGLLDDARDLDYRARLAGQLVAAMLVVLLCDNWRIGFNIGLSTSLPFLPGLLVGVLLIVGVTNAVNLADGLDGLAAGLVLMSAVSLSVVSANAAVDLPLALLVPLVGGLLGFLRFNAHPARVFMGDNGAYFLGFSLGFSALQLASSNVGISFFALIALLGVPVYDTLSVAIRRLCQGRSPFQADRAHTHHRLLAAGLSHDHAVLAMYLLHTALLGMGLALVGASEWLAAGVWFAVMLLFEAGLQHADKMFGSLGGRRLALPAVVSRRAFGAFGALALIYPLLSVGALIRPSADVAIFCLAVSSALLLQQISGGALGERAREGWTLIDRSAAYLCGGLAIYRAPTGGYYIELLWIACLLVLLLFHILGRNGALRPRALDVLVLIAVVAASTLTDLPLGMGGGSMELVALVLWFYAAEALIAMQEADNRWRLVLFAALFAYSLRYLVS